MKSIESIACKSIEETLELVKYVKSLEDRINKAIELIEKNENKGDTLAIMNDIGDALKILKGEK